MQLTVLSYVTGKAMEAAGGLGAVPLFPQSVQLFRLAL